MILGIIIIALAIIYLIIGFGVSLLTGMFSGIDGHALKWYQFLKIILFWPFYMLI